MVTELRGGVNRGDSPLGGVGSYNLQMAPSVSDLTLQDAGKMFKENCDIGKTEECKNHYYSLIKFVSVVL
jgi:hypothetical protein